jgi:hypothetical protein
MVATQTSIQLSMDSFLDEIRSIGQDVFTRLTADEKSYLTGPIIYHTGGWDAGPILPTLIPQARLDLILSSEKDLATFEEALAYLSSASHIAPLQNEDAEVMFWLTQTVWEKHNLIRGNQKFWEMLGHDRPFELTPYLEKEVLNPLRRRIRAAVIKHQKRRIVKDDDSDRS